MRKEKGVFFDFAGAAGFDHVDGVYMTWRRTKGLHACV